MHGQWMLPSLMHSFIGSIRELCPLGTGFDKHTHTDRPTDRLTINTSFQDFEGFKTDSDTRQITMSRSNAFCRSQLAAS